MNAATFSAALEAEVARAREFLRDIRDGIAGHACAARNSLIALQERREQACWVLCMSGLLDGVYVDLRVEVPYADPRQPRMRYSDALDRLRWAPVLGLATGVFAASHDRAFGRHYGVEPVADQLRGALAHAMTRDGTGLH